MIRELYHRARHTLRPLRVQFEHMLGVLFPRLLTQIEYRRMYGVPINWKHPQTIDEKIAWLRFYGDTSLWPLLADKYRVREYLADRGLGHLLVPLYGVWKRAEDIDWQSLPQQFVMKPNHGSHSVLLSTDRNSLDIPHCIKQLNHWLHIDFSKYHGETHYRKIPPCIVAEQLLDHTRQAVPSSSLIDYKVWAFNGEAKYIWCCVNRTAESVEVITYDTDWNAHPEYSEDVPNFHLYHGRLPRPLHLDEMLSAAGILSEGLPQARVDFYEVDGKLYFGEITLTSSSGLNLFYNEDFRLQLGRLTILPNESS